MSLIDICKMPLEERLQLMEQLWESFRHEKKEIDSPSWHKEVLDSRKKEYLEGNLKTITLDELKQSYMRK